MQNKKAKQEFGAAKWLCVIGLTCALGGIVGYFNLRIFGLEDGAPYIGAVAVMNGIAVGIAHYTTSKNRTMRVAAFTFDVLLFVILMISAAYSISGLREMSMARQMEQGRSASLEQAGKLKSGRAQLEAVRWLSAKDSDVESMQAIFKRYESPLFWLMIAEIGLSGLACFTLFGISHLRDDNDNGIPDIFEAEETVSTAITRREAGEFDDIEAVEVRPTGRLQGKGQR